GAAGGPRVVAAAGLAAGPPRCGIPPPSGGGAGRCISARDRSLGRAGGAGPAGVGPQLAGGRGTSSGMRRGINLSFSGSYSEERERGRHSMTMVYGLLADLIVAIHVGYVGVVVFGLLAILIGGPLGWRWVRNPWFRVIHLLMILIVATEAIWDITCPLTV